MGIIFDFSSVVQSGENLDNRKQAAHFHSVADLNNDMVEITARDTGAFDFLELKLAMCRADFERLAPQEGQLIQYRIDTCIIESKTPPYARELYRLMADPYIADGEVVSLAEFRNARKPACRAR